MLAMNRGDVYWVNFDPAVGSEITKLRPAVIVSNNKSNANISRVQVIPLTSKITKVYPCETLIFIKDRIAKAMADQITTVDKSRIGNLISILNLNEMNKIDVILKLQLNL
jgi:mRNA interferase MazF